MNKKGQVISLDFLMSVALVVLAIGLLMNALELSTYNKKQELVNNELRALGAAAAENMVTSDSFTCKIAGTNFHLPNCMDKGATIGVSDGQKLGLPDHYGFTIKNSEFSAIPPFPMDVDYYSEKREVVYHAGDISEADLIKCMNGDACPLTSGSFTMLVFKNA